ncbi:MAG: hypothetical protein ICV72_03730, partial [Aldersonia sp.]|nr:hypothetical protein [Aldersonia sp.]
MNHSPHPRGDYGVSRRAFLGAGALAATAMLLGPAWDAAAAPVTGLRVG